MKKEEEEAKEAKEAKVPAPVILRLHAWIMRWPSEVVFAIRRSEISPHLSGHLEIAGSIGPEKAWNMQSGI